MSKDELEDQLDKLTGVAQPDGVSAVAAPKKRRPAVETDVDSIELTAAEKAELDKEAAAQVSKELKAEKRKEYLAAAKQKLKKQTLFRHGKDETGADTELVLITLASHTPCLTIDGMKYYPGRAYRLSPSKAAVVKEQMYRGELHDSEIHGKNMKDFYGQRPRNMVINPSTPLPAGMH